MNANGGDSDDDTLVDGDVSISENMDGYQSAHDEFIFHIENENSLIDLSGTFDDFNVLSNRGKYGRLVKIFIISLRTHLLLVQVSRKASIV